MTARPATPVKPYIERFNNILRQRLGRFVKKTLSLPNLYLEKRTLAAVRVYLMAVTGSCPYTHLSVNRGSAKRPKNRIHYYMCSKANKGKVSVRSCA